MRRKPTRFRRIPLLVLPAVLLAAGLGALVAALPPVETKAAPVKRTAPTLATKTLVIQPLGKRLSKRDVAEVVKALETFYGFRVKVLKRRKLPRFAYYRPRRRYRAEKLLTYLGRVAPKTAYRVLGLTAVDISTTKGSIYDWGIMGLADLSGRRCIISRHRCARGSKNRTHARHRLAKTAVHEIGHTLGLDHCPNRGCLLESGKGSNKTTDREYVLCNRCIRELRRKGIVLPPNPKPPWPKPKMK